MTNGRNKRAEFLSPSSHFHISPSRRRSLTTGANNTYIPLRLSRWSTSVVPTRRESQKRRKRGNNRGLCTQRQTNSQSLPAKYVSFVSLIPVTRSSVNSHEDGGGERERKRAGSSCPIEMKMEQPRNPNV